MANHSSKAPGQNAVCCMVSARSLKISLFSMANHSPSALGDAVGILSKITIFQTSWCARNQNKSQGHGYVCMNIFASLRVYAGKWSVKARRSFTEEEQKAVASASVVPSEYGNSVCFMMVAGGKTFIPLSTNSALGVGDSVDLSKAELVTLEKQGEADIYRVEI